MTISPIRLVFDLVQVDNAILHSRVSALNVQLVC